MNPLTDLIPAKARRYVYAVASLASLGYGIWSASGGDWRQFVASMLATVVTALAHGNVSEPTDNSDVAEPWRSNP